MSPVVVEQELLSEGFPLGASVSQKVKKQNLVNEFIDLRSILSVREDPLSITVSTGVMNLHQDSKFKKSYFNSTLDRCFPRLFSHLFGKIPH